MMLWGGARHVFISFAVFCHKVSVSCASSGKRQLSPPAQPAGGDQDLFCFAGGRPVCPGKAHPPQPAPRGPHRQKVLRSPLRSGRPDLHRHHWPDEGRGYLRLHPPGQIFDLRQPVHRKCYPLPSALSSGFRKGVAFFHFKKYHVRYGIFSPVKRKSSSASHDMWQRRRAFVMESFCFSYPDICSILHDIFFYEHKSFYFSKSFFCCSIRTVSIRSFSKKWNCFG